MENSTQPVENLKGGSSKMKLPPPARLQSETPIEHSVQELSTDRGGSSKMKLGVVSKSNLYKEKNLKKEYKERNDALALIVETHSPNAKPDTTCQCAEYMQHHSRCSDTVLVQTVLLNLGDWWDNFVPPSFFQENYD